ncbi:hypothetical protein [Streptomyces paromomycinus]|uniref:Uncharacterized protein n=1 Tax=Streptomyces paromomycinus TaxID=92743 RepID=A0A401W9U5_STREY|nr:hypothetical protein [Streptomyces paromomycinus]GCD46116.1 hypothetical protein GKJPGBOP_05863 [Streptomyces paromomycinus]
MSATTGGAIKAYLESLGSGVPVFRDGPRDGQAEPYIVVQEAVSVGLDGRANGDFGDPSAEINVTEVATVDLVQRARTKTGARTAKNAERYGLAESLAHALHGCRLPAHPAPVHAVRVRDMDRFPISDNRIRVSITVEIRRGLLSAEVTPA